MPEDPGTALALTGTISMSKTFLGKKTDYPVREIMERARKGRKSIYPFSNEKSKFSIYGASMEHSGKKFFTLDNIVITPPQFTPKRLEKAIELIGREPIYHDVDLSSSIGGFKTKMPLIQSSMGSPDDWNKVAPFAAQACAESGIIVGVGENITTTWGYSSRVNISQPSFYDRSMAYLRNTVEDYGGLVIQQNEEDAYDELWNRIYSDKNFDEYIQKGLIAFEIKGGQGAKAGMGGEKVVDRETALRLKQKYTIYPDPEHVIADSYERHSAPDIFTEEILENRIKKLKNDYPRVKIWFKTGPYRDLGEVIKIAAGAGADNITIDGKEGGTGMSPSVALNDVGIPTISCIKAIASAREKGVTASMISSGRMTGGGDMVKSIALGASGIAMGRPFLVASYAYSHAEHFIERELYNYAILKNISSRIAKPDKRSITFVKNMIESIETEAKLLIASVGKYRVSDLSREDIGTGMRELSSLLGIKYIYE